jgi:hypothetical protein
MGSDGTATLYLDAVNEQYSKNSCMPVKERFNLRGKTIDEAFQEIRTKYNTWTIG